MSLTKSDLIAPPETHVVDVPGVGVVCFREATGETFDMISDGKSQIEEKGMLARIVAATVCDENGVLIFTSPSEANKVPLKRLKPLAEAAIAHCGIAPEDADELLGNSEATTPSGSGTS